MVTPEKNTFTALEYESVVESSPGVEIKEGDKGLRGAIEGLSSHIDEHEDEPVAGAEKHRKGDAPAAPHGPGEASTEGGTTEDDVSTEEREVSEAPEESDVVTDGEAADGAPEPDETPAEGDVSTESGVPAEGRDTTGGAAAPVTYSKGSGPILDESEGLEESKGRWGWAKEMGRTALSSIGLLVSVKGSFSRPNHIRKNAADSELLKEMDDVRAGKSKPDSVSGEILEKIKGHIDSIKGTDKDAKVSKLLGGFRDRWAYYRAKEQVRTFSSMSEKSKKAEEDYLLVMRAVIAHKIAGEGDEGAKRELAIGEFLGEQAALRQAVNGAARDMLGHKFAEFMEKGRFFKRMGKKALLGAALGGAVTLATGVMGVGGILGAGVGLAVKIGGRYATMRHLDTTKEKKKSSSSEWPSAYEKSQKYYQDKFDSAHTAEDVLHMTEGLAKKRTEEDAEKERSGNRRSLAATALMMAAGGAAMSTALDFIGFGGDAAASERTLTADPRPSAADLESQVIERDSLALDSLREQLFGGSQPLPTPEPTPTPTSLATETPTPSPTVEAAPSPTIESSPTPEPTPSPTPDTTPTPTPEPTPPTAEGASAAGQSQEVDMATGARAMEGVQAGAEGAALSGEDAAGELSSQLTDSVDYDGAVEGAVSHIDIGEGWYDTFEQMGLSEGVWRILLEDEQLMTQLQEMGLAYPDDSIGGWGINMTADGKMPQEALDLIRQSAFNHGFAVVA